MALGAFRKFSAFVVTPIWLPQAKTFHWRRNSWKNFYLRSRIKCNHWKELTKLVQNDLGTILIGWIVAEIFHLENTPKLLTGPNQHLFDIFLRNSICHNSAGSPRSTCFMGHFESVFRALFSCVIYIVNKQDNKTYFWIILTLWSNPYMHNSCLGVSPKYLIFRNAHQAYHWSMWYQLRLCQFWNLYHF